MINYVFYAAQMQPCHVKKSKKCVNCNKQKKQKEEEEPRKRAPIKRSRYLIALALNFQFVRNERILWVKEFANINSAIHWKCRLPLCTVNFVANLRSEREKNNFSSIVIYCIRLIAIIQVILTSNWSSYRVIPLHLRSIGLIEASAHSRTSEDNCMPNRWARLLLNNNTRECVILMGWTESSFDYRPARNNRNKMKEKTIRKKNSIIKEEKKNKKTSDEKLFKLFLVLCSVIVCWSGKFRHNNCNDRKGDITSWQH